MKFQSFNLVIKNHLDLDPDLSKSPGSGQDPVNVDP
jgi:hypothetical protein